MSQKFLLQAQFHSKLALPPDWSGALLGQDFTAMPSGTAPVPLHSFWDRLLRAYQSQSETVVAVEAHSSFLSPSLFLS